MSARHGACLVEIEPRKDPVMNLHMPHRARTEPTPDSFEHRYDELRAQLNNLVRQLDAEPTSKLERVKRAISAHPVAAIAAAVGLAFLTFRVARRR